MMNSLIHKEWQRAPGAEDDEMEAGERAGESGGKSGASIIPMQDQVREIYLEAIGKFLSIPSDEILSPDLIRFEPAKGSVNNIIRYVYLDPQHQRPQYLLRMYNNGNDLKKIQCEHLILQKLELYPKNFEVPRALHSLETHDTIVCLSNGSYASLFYIIDGVLPGLELTCTIGKACGELSLIFSNLTTQLSSEEKELISTKPYYDLYGVHEAISPETFLEEVVSEKYDSCRDDMNYLVQKVLELERNIETYHEYQLPTQLIHGDLHYDNVLVQFGDETKNHGRVSGMLDYEFCALDWKAMELAICLSKYLAQDDPLVYIVPFIHGYAQGSRQESVNLNSADVISPSPYLTEVECTVLPSLIELRILSNVIFFVGRIRARQESIEILTGGKARDYHRRLEWIQQNREKLVDTLLNSYH